MDTFDTIVKKLINVFRNQQEVLARVLFYLTEEKDAYKDQDGPAMRMLKSVSHLKETFKEYATFLAKDTEEAEKNQKFKNTLRLIYSQMMDGSEVLDDVEQPAELSLVQKLEQVSVEAAPGFIRAITLMPVESQLQMVTTINNLMGPGISNMMGKVVKTVNKYGGNKITIALAALYLGAKIIQAIRQWWNQEITGVRCAKIIIDEISVVAASALGGYAGTLIGSFFGPFGMVAGGIIGGLLAGEAASRFSDWLTQNIFSIPKDVALENAYVYFGINKNASNHDINTAYRQKCLEHHPDKGGNSEEFHKVQIHMAVIKAAKGQ